MTNDKLITVEQIVPYDKKIFSLLRKEIIPYFDKIYYDKKITSKYQDLRYTRDTYQFVSEFSMIYSQLVLEIHVDSSYYTYNTVSRDPNEHNCYFMFKINTRIIKQPITHDLESAIVKINEISNVIKEIKNEQNFYKNEVIRLQSIIDNIQSSK